jgi:hypothetical protein
MLHYVVHLLKPANDAEITATAADLVPSPTAVGEGCPKGGVRVLVGHASSPFGERDSAASSAATPFWCRRSRGWLPEQGMPSPYEGCGDAQGAVPNEREGTRPSPTDI